MRKQTVLAVLVALSMVLTACRPVFTPDGRCMHDFDTFAYRNLKLQSVENFIAPLAPWENVQPARGGSMVFSRLTAGQEELWFRTAPGFPPITGRVLNLDNGTWRDLNLTSSDEEHFNTVVNFAADHDGQVWGIGSKTIRFDGGVRNKAVLLRYRENHNDFVMVATTADEDFTLAREDNINESQIMVDSLNRVWMVISIGYTHKFYVYDPHLEALEKLPDYQPDTYKPNVTISNDGEVYVSTIVFDNFLPYHNPTQPTFAHYDSENGQWVDLDLPDGFQPREGNLGFDPQGRLHIGTSGWRDTDGTWHITYPYDSHREDIFPRVELKLISSDGRLWFTRNQLDMDGTAWYDPSTGEGCMFTSLSVSTMIEDHHQNIWMVANGSIYRLDLEAE